MNASILKPSPRFVCQICLHAVRRAPKNRRLTTIALVQTRNPASATRPSTRQFSRTSQWHDPSVDVDLLGGAASTNFRKYKKPDKSFWENQWTVYSASNVALVKKAKELGNGILSSKTIPSEEQVLLALNAIESAAQQLTFESRSANAVPNEVRTEPTEDQSPASTLLNLDRRQADAPSALPNADRRQEDAHPASIYIAVDLLSTLAYKVVTHKPVFLTPLILSTYVSLQSTLQRPLTFPEIFHLYAHKPAPIPDTSNPIRYRPTNPKSPKQAIPAGAAEAALGAAIKRKDLELALDIIDTSYNSPAFRRHKFVQKVVPALAGFSVAPFAAWIIGQSLATHVRMVEPLSTTIITFFGIMTYITSVSILGFVALTTRNDHMRRVTWVVGTPLRERWLREEERAAVDRVACAWGFQDELRHGEEEGETWVALKDWAAMRGMEVDRTDLMEGME